MTDTNLQNKARAVVLSALMVLSVMVGTIALSGAAAADTTSLDLSDDRVQGGEAFYVNGTVSANGTVHAYIDENDDGQYNSDNDTIAESVTVDNFEKDSSFSIELSAPQDSGTYDVYVLQGSLDEGDQGERSAELKVDDLAPNFGAGEDRKVTTTTPTLTVPLTDANTSVNASTIEVDVTNSNGAEVVHQVNAPSSDSDGIFYDSSAGEVQIDFSETELQVLENGDTYDVTITAADAVGNQNKTNFDVAVDTGAPTFDLVQPDNGTTVQSTDTIEVEIAGNVNASTVDITVDGPGDYLVENSSTDQDGDAGLTYTENSESPDTFAVNPGEGSISALVTGEYTVTVSGADEFGNHATSETFTFHVDKSSPIVDSVDTGQDTYYGVSPTMNVTVDFNESVDASTVAANVNVDDETLSLTDFNQGDDGDKSTVHATGYALSNFDASENASATVVVTAGDDLVGNELNETLGDNSTTFAVDTVVPDPQFDTDAGSEPLISPLEGQVDIEQYVSASDADGNEIDIGWKTASADLTAENVTWFTTPGSVNTDEITEGNVELVAQVADDNGTVVNATHAVDVDNVAPSVEYDGGALTGTESGEDYDVSELVTVSGNGTEAVTAYSYTTLGDKELSNLNWDDDFNANAGTDLTVDADATYVFAVKVNNPSGSDTKAVTVNTTTVDAEVFGSDDIDLMVDQNAAEGVEDDHFNVTVESSLELDSLNLSVVDNDDYYKSVSETVSFESLEGTEQSDGSYAYYLDYEAPRDGDFTVSIADAVTTTDGLSVEDPSGDDNAVTLVSDEHAPGLSDADVTGVTAEGYTKVLLTFDEPIEDLERSNIEFRDGVSILGVIDNEDGTRTVVFDQEIQTGGAAANLSIAAGSYEEAYASESVSENAKDDEMVSSVELDLTEGENFVSVPLETGEVSIDSLDLPANVEVIWTYDDGKWVSYDTDAEENELTALQGGQGYIVYADGQAELDVRGYTKYDTDSSNDNVPNTPAIENLQDGWNLIGHYQESQQSVGQALAPINGQTYTITNGDTGMEPATLESGEGYWLYTNEVGDHIPVDYDGMTSVQPNVEAVTLDSESVTDSGQLTVTAEVYANEPIGTVVVDAPRLGLDGETLTANGDGTYSETVDIDYADGYFAAGGDTVPVEVTAYDIYGNYDSNSETVDATARTGSLTFNDQLINGDEDVTVQSVTSNVDTKVVLMNSQDDVVGETSIAARDGTSVSVGVSDISTGTFTAQVVADDSTVLAETTATVTVDTGIDTASITSPTNGDSATKATTESLTVEYRADDSNFDSATVELVADDGNVVATASDLSAGDDSTVIDLSSDSHDVTAGTYDVDLTVTDSAGNSKTVTQTDAVTVNELQASTMETFSANPSTVTAGSTSDLTANINDQLSNDFEGETVNFEIVSTSGGDGSIDSNLDSSSATTGASGDATVTLSADTADAGETLTIRASAASAENPDSVDDPLVKEIEVTIDSQA